GLDDLSVRVSFDDIPSLTPLRDIVRDGHARLRATIRGRPSLNLIERLAFLGRETIAVARLDQDVAIPVPGGLPGLLALDSPLAEPVWGIGRRVTSIAMSDVAPVIPFDAGTVALESRYRLRNDDDVVRSMTRITAGFLLDDRTVLATAESVEPWVFDPLVAQGLRDRSLRLVDGSLQIHLTRSPVSDGGQSAAATDSCGGVQEHIRIAKTLNERVQAFAHPTGQPFELRLRDTAGNVALLDVRCGSYLAAPRARVPVGSRWQPVTVPGAAGTGAF